MIINLRAIINKILYLLTKKERIFAIVILLLMIFSVFFEFISIGLLVPLTTGLLGNDSDVNYGGSLLNQILGIFFGNIFKDWKNTDNLIILFLAFNALKACFSICNVFLQTKFSQDLCLGLSEKLYEIYLKQDYIFHLKNNSAKLLRNIQTEINQFNYLITSLILLLSEASVVLGIIVMLSILNPILILSLVLFFGALSTLFYNLTKKNIGIWGRERQIVEEKINKNLLQSFSGIKEIIQLNKAFYFIKEYALNVRRKNYIAKWTLFIQQIPRYLLEFIFLSFAFILFIYVKTSNYNVSSFISLFGVLTFSAFKFLPSINKIMSALVAIRYSKPAVDTLFKELSLSCAHINENPINSISFSKQIELRNIKFWYDLNNDSPIIDIDNLVLKKGEIIGILGKSGSGKSTLLDIIIGVLNPTFGVVLVDGVNIKENLHSWYRHIGYVSQAVFLLDKSVKNNIAFGIPEDDVNLSQVINSLKLSKLGNYDEIFSLGYDTIVGERGTSVSGGQMQRIAIARALYNNPDILIFDEATSALDKETESDFVQTIKELALTKTIIIVSHNSGPLKICHRVYEIDEGKLKAN